MGAAAVRDDQAQIPRRNRGAETWQPLSSDGQPPWSQPYGSAIFLGFPDVGRSQNHVTLLLNGWERGRAQVFTTRAAFAAAAGMIVVFDPPGGQTAFRAESPAILRQSVAIVFVLCC